MKEYTEQELSALPIDEQIKIKLEAINECDDLNKLPLVFHPHVDERNYFFVSYSWHDFKKVYKDILYLQKYGLKLWHDRGNPAGKDWEDYVEKILTPFDCKGVILYVSEHSLLSSSTIKELKILQEIGKPIVPILIAETDSLSSTSILSIIQKLSKDNPKAFKKKDIDMYTSLFKGASIFLPIDMDPQSKVEKILLKVKFEPKLVIEKDCIVRCADPLTRKITFSDFQDSINKIKKQSVLPEKDSIDKIGDCAFAQCSYLKTIDFGEKTNISHVGRNAFYCCKSLTKLNLFNQSSPISKKSLNRSSFKVEIDDFAFANCDSLEYIGPNVSFSPSSGQGAFLNCKRLKKIEIFCPFPSRIPDGCFSGCSSLESVQMLSPKVSSDATNSPNEICLFEIGLVAFADCSSLKTIDLSGVVTIQDSAFFGCRKLSKIIQNHSIRSINESAFAGCESLEEIQLGSSLEDVDDYAFQGCRSLKTIYWYCDSPSMSSKAFDGCDSIDTLIICKSANSYNYYSFASILNKPSLKTIKVEKGNSSFKYKNGFFSFQNKLIRFISDSNSKDVMVPDDINDISTNAFAFNNTINTVILFNKIKHIDIFAFAECENLERIAFLGTKKEWHKINKDQKWNHRSSLKYVKCSDGVIEL